MMYRNISWFYIILRNIYLSIYFIEKNIEENNKDTIVFDIYDIARDWDNKVAIEVIESGPKMCRSCRNISQLPVA